MKYKVLFVDDEPANLRALERLFRSQYDVVTASSGDEGLALLQTHNVVVIVSDQRMPGMCGVDFLKRAAEIRPQTVRLILTGYTDVNSLVDALNSGVVYKFITKPWENADLQQTVRIATERYEVVRAQYQLESENSRLRENARKLLCSAVESITPHISLHDSGPLGHAFRTAQSAKAIGDSLALEKAALEEVFLAGFFHAAEHVDENGSGPNSFVEILSLMEENPSLRFVQNAIKRHREEFEQNSAADQHAQLPARIVAVSHAYDRLIFPADESVRYSDAEALERLREEAGVRYDPEVIEALAEAKFRETHDAARAGHRPTTDFELSVL